MARQKEQKGKGPHFAEPGSKLVEQVQVWAVSAVELGLTLADAGPNSDDIAAHGRCEVLVHRLVQKIAPTWALRPHIVAKSGLGARTSVLSAWRAQTDLAMARPGCQGCENPGVIHPGPPTRNTTHRCMRVFLGRSLYQVGQGAACGRPEVRSSRRPESWLELGAQRPDFDGRWRFRRDVVRRSRFLVWWAGLAESSAKDRNATKSGVSGLLRCE